jgi:O-antigen/teichoic acid export membrane protein
MPGRIDTTPSESMARNTLLNLFGQLVPMMIGLVSIPLLIRHIGMERFGLLSLIWVVIGYFTFFDLGLGRAIIKLVAEKIGADDQAEIPKIFWNALLIMA